jgi:hypothetical protein
VPVSTPVSMGQDVIDNDVGLFGDYSNTGTVAMDSDDYGANNVPSAESSEGNFVQNAEMSIGEVPDFKNANSVPTETNIQTDQALWSLSSSNVSLHMADNSATTSETDYDISNHDSSDTAIYNEDLLTKEAEFSTQDDSSQPTSYSTEMSTNIYITTNNILTNTDVTHLEHTDETDSTELDSERQTTETSVNQFTAHIQYQSSGEYSATKSSGDTGDRVLSNSDSNNSLKHKPIESRAETDRIPLTVVSDKGILKAYPSMVKAETEILVHDNETRHRNYEVQNHDVATKRTLPQMSGYKTELSDVDEKWTTDDFKEINTVSHRDTTTEFQPSVSVSEVSIADELPTDKDNVAVTLFQSVADNTVTSVTPLNQGSGDTATNMEINSGEVPVRLYGEIKVTQDYDQNLFVSTNEVSVSQTEPATLILSTDLVNSLLLTATDTPISATQNSEVPKDEIITNFLSELMSTDYKQFPSKDRSAVTESTGQFLLTQSLLKDTAGADSKTLSSDPDTTYMLFQPPKTESEILKNTKKEPEIINGIPVMIATEISLHGKMTSTYGQATTSSGKNYSIKTSGKPLYNESNNIDIVSALVSEERAQSFMPEPTEVTSFEIKSTSKEEFTTESFESPKLGLHETTVPLQSGMLEFIGIPVDNNQLSTSETITEHVTVLGTEQPNEITTNSLPLNVEMSEKQQEVDETEGSDVSSSIAPVGGLELKSGTGTESKSAVSAESDGNLEDVTEVISTMPTVITYETTVTSEGNTVLPVVFKTIDLSTPAITTHSSNPSSTAESSDSSISVHSSILSNSIVPAVGDTTEQTSVPSLLCSIATFEKFQGTNCWLVQFLTPYSSNGSMCLGSYLDSNTIVTSASCISRLEDS